jgi:hypothetical protein
VFSESVGQFSSWEMGDGKLVVVIGWGVRWGGIGLGSIGPSGSCWWEGWGMQNGPRFGATGRGGLVELVQRVR